MTIKPILKYPGAKWSIADWIISHFPPHQHYIEPYFGSGAVFFNKQPAAHEVINDLSGDVVNLFRVIREDGERLAALIQMTPWAREEYEVSYQPCDDALERARRFVVRCWQGHGGANIVGASAWRHQGRDENDKKQLPAQKWLYMPSKVMALVDRLQGVEIEQRPAVNVIERHNTPGILIYADPPYPQGERRPRMYQHEMTDADHLALLDALDAHLGPVVLSGYYCPLYDDRLSHWHTREKRTQAEKGNIRTEVLWLNQTCIDRLGYGPLFGSLDAA